MIPDLNDLNTPDSPLDTIDDLVVSGEPAGKNSSLHSLFSTVGILLLAPLIAVLLTLFVFQSYQVDGPSMETTLQNNDRLIVWKLPRTWARVTGHQYVPGRGDIIILNESGLSTYGSNSDTKQLVKRVIGLPGDRVVIKTPNTPTAFNPMQPSPTAKTAPYPQPLTTQNSPFRLPSCLCVAITDQTLSTLVHLGQSRQAK